MVFASVGLILVKRNDGGGTRSADVLDGSQHSQVKTALSVVEKSVSTKILMATDVEGQPALTAPDREGLFVKDPPPLLALLGAKNSRPELEPEMVLDVLKSYRRLLGAFPAGEDNRQFVNALLGANRERLPFLSPDHPRINSRGEIVDAWSTPFFFHLNSRVSVEVRSAGPDQHFFTSDDIVAGKVPDLHGQFEPASENVPVP